MARLYIIEIYTIYGISNWINRYIKPTNITNFIIDQRSLMIKDMRPTTKGITVLPNIMIRNKQRSIANILITSFTFINFIVFVFYYKYNDFFRKIQ